MEKDKRKIIAGASILGAGLIAYFATRKGKGKPPVQEITLSNLAITPTTVSPGEAVTISVLVTNHSDSPLVPTVNLKGDFTDSQSITVDGGALQTVSFTVTPTAEKTYNVSVDGLSGSFVCTSAPHGDIALSNLVISPASCNQGDTVTISVTATNNGNANEVMAVTLKIAGNKYNDTTQPSQQIILEPGKSKIVTFTFQPTVAETYTVTTNGLFGTFVINAAPTWPGWTAGTFVDEVTVTPTILYLGQTVTIAVAIEWPYPAALPANIEASINVDSATLSKVVSIDFRNPAFLFTYTPTNLGTYTVKAQDKTATFQVVANPTGTYYLPFGGKRMPICTDIVIPNVPPFKVFYWLSTQTFNWPGGDLKYSDIAMISPGFFSGVTSFPILFPLSAVTELVSRLSSAQPIAWNPSGANITNYLIQITTSKILNGLIISIMATDYTCEEYWSSKDELASMMVDFNCRLAIPDAWKTQYGKIELSVGIRDWVYYPGIKSQCMAGTCRFTITCPYGNDFPTTNWVDPYDFDKLSFARSFLEHIERAHPNHPLTEPAWF
jgi:hypothetical protein